MSTTPVHRGMACPRRGRIDVTAHELPLLARFIGETIDETQANVKAGSGFRATAQRLFCGELRMCRIVAPVPSGVLSYQRAVGLIDQPLHDPLLDVATLAGHMRCSKRYLHLVFQRHGQGRTVRAHITARRLARSRDDLLAEPDTPIAAIALRWGFDDPASFARAFRSEFGATPRAWQRNIVPTNDGPSRS